jgi:L-cysteate sulfo-lyase
VTTLAGEALALLGGGPALGEDAVSLDFSQLGDGYGALTEAAAEAIRLLARTEGVVLDPVYTAKAMAGLIADARAGRVSSPVVFWHTGGGPSLFAAGWGERLLA